MPVAAAWHLSMKQVLTIRSAGPSDTEVCQTLVTLRSWAFAVLARGWPGRSILLKRKKCGCSTGPACFALDEIRWIQAIGQAAVSNSLYGHPQMF